MFSVSRQNQEKKNNHKVVKKLAVYREFVLWTAMPADEQKRLGIETQQQFAEYYGISRDTCTQWLKRPEFETQVDELLKIWSVAKTPTVIKGIYNAAVKGNPMSQLLWLQYFKKFNPKQEIEHTHRTEIGVNDIRFLIEALPEPLKSKHYANLRELLEDGQRLRHAGELENSTAEIEGPTDGVPDETDHDAHNVSEPRTNEMAGGYQKRVCEHLVGKVAANYNQSTARWWQE